MKKSFTIIVVVFLSLFFGSSVWASEIYVVKKGDQLNKIAKIFRVNAVDIYEANIEVIGSNPDLIYPGQKLVLPKGEVVSNVEIKASQPPALENSPRELESSLQGELLTENQEEAFSSDILSKFFFIQYFEKKEITLQAFVISLFIIAAIMVCAFFVWLGSNRKEWLLFEEFGSELQVFVGFLEGNGCREYLCVDDGMLFKFDIKGVSNFIANNFGKQYKAHVTFDLPSRFKNGLIENGIDERLLASLEEKEIRDLIKEINQNLRG